MSFVIRYDSFSIVNGKRVGIVYVQRVADIITGYDKEVYSYTYDIAKATRWDGRAETEALVRRARWNAAEIVELLTDVK